MSSSLQRVPWSGEPPTTWSDVEWPSWVPQRTRDEIASFWGPAAGRRPRDYERGITGYPWPLPALGERVRLRLGGGRRWVEGRYVHAWNNIGRVVTDDGSVALVSTTDYPDNCRPSSPMPTRDPLFAAAWKTTKPAQSCNDMQRALGNQREERREPAI